VFSERIAVSWFYGQSESLTKSTLVSTLGLGLFMTAITGIIVGSDPHPVPSFISVDSWQWFGVPVRPQYVIMFVAAAAICLTLDRVMASTELGLVMRATIQDREGASILGITPRVVTLTAFAVGGGMAALAGALVAPLTNAYPNVGGDLALYGFAAMAIGGYGNFRGAAFGGLAIGIVGGLAPIEFSPQLTRPIIYGVLLIVLLIRPIGIFGTPGAFGATSIREA
jgi:branched-chain amino acid transport system permease protein